MEEEEQEKFLCSDCQTEYDNTDELISLTNGEWGCTDCYSVCDNCSDGTHTQDSFSVSGWVWCEVCRSDHAFWCSYCDEYYDERRVGYTEFDSETYCEDCIGNVAYYCEECDDWESNDYTCESREGDRLIHDYSYKPNPIFIGTPKNKVYLGWELEADAPQRNREEVAEYAAPILEGLAYLKHDGSVPNGIEIVTHPIAHNKVRELDIYWDTIEKLRTDYGMRSWDSKNYECGLHIHISRAGFSNGSHIHRFLQLVYSNAELMARFAGRTTRYATFQDVWDFDEFGVPHRTYKSKLGRRGERNSAVNTYPEHTIELRFFRGTMRKEGILACLDLAQAMVEYTRNLNAHDVIKGLLSWEGLYDYVEANNGIYPDAYNRMPKVATINLKNLETLNA